MWRSVDKSTYRILDALLERVVHQRKPSVLTVNDAATLLSARGNSSVFAIAQVADMCRKVASCGDHVTYVINRNINFTNACTKVIAPSPPRPPPTHSNLSSTTPSKRYLCSHIVQGMWFLRFLSHWYWWRSLFPSPSRDHQASHGSIVVRCHRNLCTSWSSSEHESRPICYGSQRNQNSFTTHSSACFFSWRSVIRSQTSIM